VMRYMETFKAKEVPSPDHKKKHEVENDDVWELEDELKHKKRRIDKEVEARGTIMNPNEIGCTRLRGGHPPSQKGASVGGGGVIYRS
jgi:hypothetical protein